MLSYKHGYHAGNHADVLKHIVLIYLYNLTKKTSKSISYIDTHSGNGKYKYTSRYMDIKECSEYCGVSRSTLHRNVKENKLKASNTTGKLLFKVSDVNAWVEN